MSSDTDAHKPSTVSDRSYELSPASGDGVEDFTRIRWATIQGAVVLWHMSPARDHTGGIISQAVYDWSA